MPGTATVDDPGGRLRELLRAGRFADVLAAFRTADGDLVRRRPELRLIAATAATRLGELESAEQLARSALDGFSARCDLDGRMRALNLLGVVAFERGRPGEAEAAFSEVLDLARELADTQVEARACNNLASVSHLRGRAPDAVSLYRGALLSYQRVGDRRGAAETFHNLGHVFRHMAAWREADDAVAEALRHAEAVNERSLLAITALGQAELHVDRGDLSLAAQVLDQAARLAAGAGDEISAAEVRRIRGLAALRLGDAETAVREAGAAHTAAVANDVALLRAESAVVLALALRRLGDPDTAELRRREAQQIFEELGAVAFAERLAEEWSR